jgi:hypothetical protein
MLDKLIGALIGYAICRLLAGGEALANIFHVSHKTGPGPGPAPSPEVTTTVVNFPTQAPTGLPAWPTGWRVYPSPIPSSVVQRAVALLPVMGLEEHKTEMGPNGWVTYYKSKQGKRTGVTAWIPKVAVSTAAA